MSEPESVHDKFVWDALVVTGTAAPPRSGPMVRKSGRPAELLKGRVSRRCWCVVRTSSPEAR